jgi:hypothetical protein
MKMLAIGLGKQYGASICHQHGFNSMGRNVWDFGKVIIARTHIAFALALIENAHHSLYKIDVMSADEIEKREPELLDEYRNIMPRIPFDFIDVLVISEMGKEISGAGVDPNISGRSAYLETMPPHPQKIVVLDLTDKSEGNAAGMGNVDIISKRLYDKIDFVPIYVNAVTCRDTLGSRLPMVMPNDELALKAAIYAVLNHDEKAGYKIVWIKNTSNLSVMYISESLIADAERIPALKVLGRPEALTFTADGDFSPGLNMFYAS